MEVAQSRPTFCNPMHCSPSSFSVHGIVQARILEWIVISFSSGSSRPRDQTQVSCIAGRFFTTKPTRKPNIYSQQNIIQPSKGWKSDPCCSTDGTWGHSTQRLIIQAKYITNKALVYSAGSSSQYSVTTYMRKESEKRMNICEYITESLCCTPETNTKL